MKLYSYRYWKLNQLIWEKYQLNNWKRWTIQLSHQSRLKIMSTHLRKISKSHWIEKNQFIDQSNNSFVYMKKLESSKNSCKINLHEKKQKNHMIYRDRMLIAMSNVYNSIIEYVFTRMFCAFSLKFWLN